MKKILVVTESKSVWGAERSLLQLSTRARHEGVELHFLISVESPLAIELQRLNLEYTFHDFARHPALEQRGSMSGAGFLTAIKEVIEIVRGAWRLRPKLKGYDSTLVFSVWQAPEAILASWAAGLPADLDLHETFGNSRGMFALGMISRVCRRVMVPSKTLAERSGLRPSGRVAVIPRPVERAAVNLSTARGESGSPMIVGVFGQIERHKRVLEVVQQIESLGQCVRLLVVGGKPDPELRSDYENEVRRVVYSLGTASEVVNYTPEVASIMATCDIVVNASEHEAFGRTIVEAVSAGCYPVAVGNWGPAETVGVLGTGAVVQSISEIGPLFAELLIARKKGPLLERVPETLHSYELDSVAVRYFNFLKSGKQ